jgi:hypothetical protein
MNLKNRPNHFTTKKGEFKQPKGEGFSIGK